MWLLTSSIALLIFAALATVSAAAEQAPLGGEPLPFYKFGDPIPVACLNRTTDTGEHMTDAQGRLEYLPFPTCEETGRPLELYFGVERGMHIPELKQV